MAAFDFFGMNVSLSANFLHANGLDAGQEHL